MLQINYIRENAQEIIDRLAIKNYNASEIIPNIIELDKNKREAQSILDNILSESNIIAKEIGKLFKIGKVSEAHEKKQKSIELKKEAKKLNSTLDSLAKDLNDLLYQVPNVPHPSVKPGKSDADNEVVLEEGEIPCLEENAIPHWELATKYDLIDFELGSKITGAGFPVYKGKAAKLQRALINFFLDEAIKIGYQEVQPPLLINEASGFGTGQLPDKDGQMYHIGADNLYLIPTAEVPITNIYRNTILKSENLPIKVTAYSSCFRREAGSYGKDVRGLNRLHQFDKVEIVQLQHPDKSYDTHNEMCEYVASLIRKLELPFRILRLCGGDTSFTAALTYDFEVYSVAQKKWLEVSSVSNFEAFQSNRLKLRYKEKNGKTKLAHTLNGSALALPRIVAALFEINQTENGIKVPEVLVPFTGFEFLN